MADRVQALLNRGRDVACHSLPLRALHIIWDADSVWISRSTSASLPLCEGMLLLDMATILGHAAKYSFPYLRGDASTVQVVGMNHLLVDLDVPRPAGPTPQARKSAFKFQAQNRYYESETYEEYEELIFGPRIPQGNQGGLGVGLSLECNPAWFPQSSEGVVIANFYCEADIQLLDTSSGVRSEIALVGSSQLALQF